jgi:mono/diheme cytochrome c family protein
MKRALRWLGVSAAMVILAVGGLVGWVQFTWSFDHPGTPYPDVRASSDADVIARGEYLVHAVAHCSACHAPTPDGTSPPFDPTAPLVGGYFLDAGPFGQFTAANLTPHPTGIGALSDAEVARVIRHGINRQGRLSPVMRLAVGNMAEEDLTAVISWLRVQEPVEALRAGPRFGFLAKALSRRLEPRLGAPPPFVPEGGISLERGRYLAEGAAFCSGCHTPVDPMAGFAPVGPSLSGAAEAEPDPKSPGHEIIAPNLTPHPETGHIAGWDEERFVARFRAGRIVEGSAMPWESFQLMTEEDVRSIYRYLRSLEGVEHDTGPSHRRVGSFRPS